MLVRQWGGLVGRGEGGRGGRGGGLEVGKEEEILGWRGRRDLGMGDEG